MSKVLIALAAAACVLTTAAPARAAPVFILNNTGGVDVGTQARAGFEAAAALWSSALSTDVTIRLDVGFRALSSGVLGSAGATRANSTYSSIRTALTDKRSSSLDNSAVASLGSSLSFLSNEPGNCETGVGCTLPSATSRTLDADNTYDNRYLSANSTLLKALGLRLDTGGRDAAITFSTAVTWDFDQANGVASGAYDFVGIAAHEIGHALGFTSGVDIADSSIGAAKLDTRSWGAILDLFRYTGTQRDWTVGGTPCTSADGGRSCLGRLATGKKYGDRRQASHWKDNGGIGIFDPTAVQGEYLRITQADLSGLDIIGWNLAPSALNPFDGQSVFWGSEFLKPDGDWDSELIFAPVPTAPSALVLGAGMAMLAAARRRRRGVD